MTTLALPLAAATAVVCLAGMPVAAGAQDAAAGSACVAVAPASVEGVDGSASDVASAVRDLFVSFLSGPAITVMALESRLPAQAALEARQRGCGTLVIPAMTRKRSGGSRLGGVLGRAAGTAVWHVPYGLGAGAVAGAAAVAGAEVVSGLASDTRRKDEIRLSYRVGPPDSVGRASPVTSKAKAKVDGQDLLTPLVERAAQDIFTRVTTR